MATDSTDNARPSTQGQDPASSTTATPSQSFWKNPVKSGWTKISISTIVLVVVVVVIVKFL